MATNSSTSQEYGAEQIQALEGLEPVRRTPGMYIGSTGPAGLHHLIWEVIDNSVDEAMAGHCDQIDVTINSDGSVTVQDNGRGIPVEPQKSGRYEGVPTVEMVFTVLHAGGKFGTGAYQVSGGLHGVGISVVNALSEWTEVEVRRNGKVWKMAFESIEENGHIVPGVVAEELSVVGKCEKSETGTRITFMPDADVFTRIEFDHDTILRRLKQTAYLNAGVTVTFQDLRKNWADEPAYEFSFPGGIADYLSDLAIERLIESDKDPDQAADFLIPSTPVLLDGDEDGTLWEVAIQWFPDSRYTVLGFVNGIETPDHGTHVDGFQGALTPLLNKYARQPHIGLLGDKSANLEAVDVRTGVGVIVSVKTPHPQFYGQTKSKLGNEEVKGIVRRGVTDALWNWLQENPPEAKLIATRAVNEMELRYRLAEAARKERERTGSTGIAPRSQQLPAKLNDCETSDRSIAELFIVEGDSAAGPAIMARDRVTQAVLPIRGKGLNIERADASRIAANPEIQGLIATIGAGSEELFDLDQARYGKVVILTDADDDGRHIQLLLMTAFYRLMTELVEDGRLYVARSPLFSTVISDKKVYAHTEADRDKIEADNPRRNLIWTRHKGLGEMNPDELGETAIWPSTRRLARVVVQDPDETDETIVRLMGRDSQAKWDELQAVTVSAEELVGV